MQVGPKALMPTGYFAHNFYNGITKDCFVTNPLFNKNTLENQIVTDATSNQRIMQLLTQHNIPVKPNINELQKLKSGHMNDTRVIAAKMYSSLPKELKEQVNLSDVQQAAMYHDYGKVLIPDSILNKNGKLDSKEQAIMELHSELGYELLKNKGLNENTLNLIKYHHQNHTHTGYPNIATGYQDNLEQEILTVADKYSALCEERSYKKGMSSKEALKIIEEDVKNGNISQIAYEALVKATKL